MTFRALFRHFREMRFYFLAVSAIFVVSIVMGTTHWNEEILLEQLKGIQQIVESVDDKEATELWLFIGIFKNNLTAMLLMVALGIFFGIFPFFSLFINGLILGYVGDLAMEQVSFFNFAKAIVPHGILEIPALLLAAAYGLKLGGLSFRAIGSLFSRSRGENFAADFMRVLKLLVPLIGLLVILLFFAALIESTLTLWLVQG